METKRSLFIREATGLRRELSPSDVLMFNVLCMGIAWAFIYICFAVAAKLASINERTGSPNYALTVVAVIMMAYVLISNFAAGALVVLAYTTSGIFLAIVTVGVPAIMLPYKHKEEFHASPQ